MFIQVFSLLTLLVNSVQINASPGKGLDILNLVAIVILLVLLHGFEQVAAKIHERVREARENDNLHRNAAAVDRSHTLLQYPPWCRSTDRRYLFRQNTIAVCGRLQGPTTGQTAITLSICTVGAFGKDRCAVDSAG